MYNMHCVLYMSKKVARIPCIMFNTSNLLHNVDALAHGLVLCKERNSLYQSKHSSQSCSQLQCLDSIDIS